MLFTVAKFVAVSLCITGLIALGLIASQKPAEITGSEGLDFTDAILQDLSALPDPSMVTMRDGTDLAVRRYGDAGPLVVMVHGSGWNGMQFHSLATALGAQAQVLVPDLRGHGANPERRGDVDYIGQFEDDLADLIAATKAQDQRVMLLGHSSGGGLVVRFAGGTHGSMIDHAVLLAPFLKHNAPTTRKNAGGWSHVLMRRIIGLSMLNTFGITALNHLTIIQFNMPRVVLDGPLGHTATTSYSYRLNTGFAPRGAYADDIAALPAFELIVGADDEAMVADAYEPLMAGMTGKGRYRVLPDVGHLGVVDAPETLTAIQESLSDL
ncbi:Non-heme chloroperoxidase [Ascidiaceihabitans donghaensis]|uniref:protein phosphatase methylesterase-1 n=1 Tax=Ascidiaceihabitans donghaensis TaxID=1510460 RepID=A0A2R8BDT9_9RHOB|nr:alpha/beta hydrolase [Ascidiaceihabitans donghaensis]SPH21239.1 Non-heme chloroperoxidase [Ascidiaceihabitans donghaensis]